MKAVLVIGSNCTKKEDNIRRALKEVKRDAEILRSSSVYLTPDVRGGLRPYLNVVLEVESSMEENLLATKMKGIESLCGRVRPACRNDEVALDIDIVIWDGKIRRPKDYEAAYFKTGYADLEEEK